jgi:hypothetical protein
MVKPLRSMLFIGCVGLAALLSGPAVPEEPPAQKQGRPAAAFPLKAAAGGRYLVDQNGVPFLIAGESPQALMVTATATGFWC